MICDSLTEYMKKISRQGGVDVPEAGEEAAGYYLDELYGMKQGTYRKYREAALAWQA